MRPDGEIKSSQSFSKSCPKRSRGSFCQRIMLFIWTQRVIINLGYFYRKYATLTFLKSPNWSHWRLTTESAQVVSWRVCNVQTFRCRTYMATFHVPMLNDLLSCSYFYCRVDIAQWIHQHIPICGRRFESFERMMHPKHTQLNRKLGTSFYCMLALFIHQHRT